MTAARTAFAPTVALVLAASAWGCSSTSGSNAAVQLPPRQPDLAAGGGYGTGAGNGTAPGVYGSSAPQAPNAGGRMAANTGVCNAGAARSVIGQLGTVDAKESAKAASGAETVRITYPGQPLTQDVVPARLNLETDNQNRIVNVRCG